MTPSRLLRPALVCLALCATGLSIASCSADDAAPHRFAALADDVARLPLDGGSVRAVAPPASSSASTGLRSALAPLQGGLKVEVMDPHDLWDARDQAMRGRVRRLATAEAAGPAIAGTVTRSASTPAEVRPAPADGLRRPARQVSRTTIQLGAYSSEAAARSAWNTVSTGAGRVALSGLTPVFEPVLVNGRPFTRLKVAAPTTKAAAICRAAEVSDPWCARPTLGR